MTEAYPSGLFLFSVSRKNKTQVSPKTVAAFCGRQTSRLCPFFFFFSCLALKVVKIENKQCKSLFGLSINESLRPHVTSVARCIARAGRFSCQQASSQEFGFAPSDIPKCCQLSVRPFPIEPSLSCHLPFLLMCFCRLLKCN